MSRPRLALGIRSRAQRLRPCNAFHRVTRPPSSPVKTQTSAASPNRVGAQGSPFARIPSWLRIYTGTQCQGSEADAVIICTTQPRPSTFGAEPKLCNVLLTRTRNTLYLCSSREWMDSTPAGRAVLTFWRQGRRVYHRPRIQWCSMCKSFACRLQLSQRMRSLLSSLHPFPLGFLTLMAPT